MMGGFGSGRPSGSGRDTAEGARSLDINRLNRAGCLRPGYLGSWQWTRDGERVADIAIQAAADLLTLSYRIRQQGGEWRDVEQPTPIVWVRCRFGGRRPYFLCPGRGCGRRVSNLYGAGTYFLCRHCYRLAYASQRENHFDRALRRANNIRMRLGGEPCMASLFPKRPKGMHRRNYERLRSEVWRAEMLAEERFDTILERLQRIECQPRIRTVRRSSKGFWT
jgi:hypothetical protein